MSNRFTKATPVEYLPIDTSLMLKAGLAKDEQIQEGIDAAQKGVDALANMKSSYTTDHNYVNSYYDGVMSNLREKVKNTASFNDPNFKSNINQVINGAIKDPTLWNVNRRNQVYDSTVKAMQSNPKISNSYKTVWGDSYTKQDQSGNPGGTGMINIPSPFEQHDINKVLGENQTLIKEEIRKTDDGFMKKENSTTYRGTVKMIDPQTGKEVDVPVGRHESLAMRNIFNDSQATNQLLYDFKASKRMTFDDDYDATEFKDYVINRVQGYGGLMDVNSTSREMGDVAKYQQKYAFKTAYDNLQAQNDYKNLLTTTDKPVTNEQFIPEITKNATGRSFTPEFRDGFLVIPQNPKSTIPGGSNKGLTIYDNKQNEEVINKYKIYLDNFTENYLNSFKDNPQLLKQKQNELRSHEQKHNFITNAYKNSISFDTVIPLGPITKKYDIGSYLVSSINTGSAGIVSSRGDISQGTGTVDAVAIDFGYTDAATFSDAIVKGDVNVSYNVSDIMNNGNPTFRISRGDKNATISTSPQLQTFQIENDSRIFLMNDALRKGNIEKDIINPVTKQPIGKWEVNQSGALEGRLYTTYLSDGSGDPTKTQSLNNAAYNNGLSTLSTFFVTVSNPQNKTSETDQPAID